MVTDNGTSALKHHSINDRKKRVSSEKTDPRLEHDVEKNGNPTRKLIKTENKQEVFLSENIHYRLENDVIENGHPTMAHITTEEKKGTYKVYPSRWIMLFIASSLNLSTSMNWITFAAAADTSVEFYNISTLQLNILSMCFVLVTIPVGLTAAWVTDTFGLRATFMIAAWSNGVGSLLRNVSAMDIVPLSSKYSVVLIGQILIACGEKFVMMIPTKLAALWFPENRRALANMIGGIIMLGLLLLGFHMISLLAADAVGNMVAFIVVPVMVDVKSDIPSMLWVMSVTGMGNLTPPAKHSVPFSDGYCHYLRDVSN
ncbi:solute carrier family 49 member A3-like [Mercenaria mercenaria]|uniref:solute carrier family 49 member A3-like n=1 Tax=Mercenaria mercenaria TaxID=6596 RepID=UPI00234E81AD|nr:solute carrier family 49 member A3-like [Mercenaria mercenaria]